MDNIQIKIDRAINMEELKALSVLINQKNEVENSISKIINRPAIIGHAGEYIASRIFNINLMESASHKGIDGYFSDGSLQGKSVNIKWYTKQSGLLDINPDCLPDYFLVMTGGKEDAASSKGKTLPWCIKQVYLFDAHEIANELAVRGVRIGIATSIKKDMWECAEIYPTQRNQSFVMSEKVIRQLKLFDFLVGEL